MNARHEDGPPNVPARHYVAPVIDQVMTLCMAQRQARAKHAVKIIGSCDCGRPAFYLGLCRGCSSASVASSSCECGQPAVADGRCRGCDENAFDARNRALPAHDQRD
jgi:hypothetical protein